MKNIAFQIASKNWRLVQRLRGVGGATCLTKGVDFMCWLGSFFGGKPGRVFSLCPRKIQEARAKKKGVGVVAVRSPRASQRIPGREYF